MHQKKMSLGRISKVTGLSKNTISRWIAKFAVETDIDNPVTDNTPKSGISGSPSPDPRQEVLELRKQLEAAKKELLKQKITAEAYSRMIDIAEERFNIPIRKKAGAKQ